MLIACPACRRHVHHADTRCPFCAAAVPRQPLVDFDLPRMSRAALVAAAMTAGCSKPAEPTIVAEPPAASSKVAAPSASASSLLGTGPAEDAGLGGLGLAGVGLGAAYGAPPPPGWGLGIGTVDGGPSKPAVKVAVTTSSATSDDAAVVAKHRWRFQACANKGALADPALEGVLTLEASIEPDGTVKSTTTTKSTGHVGPPFSLCATSALRSVMFSARAAPSKCTVTLDVKPAP